MNPVKNCILTKTSVGQVRLSYHKLPPASFVYGKFTKKDGEGASEMIKNWKYHQGSLSPVREDSYILSNSMSVANGLHKGSEFVRFRKSVQGKIKSKNGTSSSSFKIPDIVHGVPLRPSTPMQAVMTNFYGNLVEKMNEGKGGKVKGKSVKNPNFSLRPRVLIQSASKPEFKLKRFANVQSKAKCWVAPSQC